MDDNFIKRIAFLIIGLALLFGVGAGVWIIGDMKKASVEPAPDIKNGSSFIGQFHDWDGYDGSGSGTGDMAFIITPGSTGEYWARVEQWSGSEHYDDRWRNFLRAPLRIYNIRLVWTDGAYVLRDTTPHEANEGGYPRFDGLRIDITSRNPLTLEGSDGTRRFLAFHDTGAENWPRVYASARDQEQQERKARGSPNNVSMSDMVTWIIVGVAVLFQFMLVFLEDDWNLPYAAVDDRLDRLKSLIDRFPLLKFLLHYGEIIADILLLVSLASAFFAGGKLDHDEMNTLMLVAGCEAYSLVLLAYNWYKKKNIWERHYMFFIFCGPSVILMQNIFHPGLYRVKDMADLLATVSLILVFLTHAWGPFQTIVFNWNTKAVMRMLIDYIPRGILSIVALFALFTAGFGNAFGLSICLYLTIGIIWKASANWRNSYLRLNE